MKSTRLFIVIAASLIIGGCKSAGSDSEIATDMCGCFNKLKATMPPEATGVFEKAAVAADPKETFAKEMQSLDPAVVQKINEALMSTGSEGSPVNSCLKELDKKYKSPTASDQEAAERMVKALKDKKGCDIMMALMRMNTKK